MTSSGPRANDQPGRTPPDYLLALARFVCGTRLPAIPHGVTGRCKRVIADRIALTRAGMQTPEMRALAHQYLADKPPGESWVIGTGLKALSEDAAFLNGTAGTFHDFDEGNTTAHGHPGMQALPAALAYAQRVGASGADLLLAAVLGYEVCARVGAASKMRVAVHPHGTFGVIGAAVALARLKGF